MNDEIRGMIFERIGNGCVVDGRCCGRMLIRCRYCAQRSGFGPVRWLLVLWEMLSMFGDAVGVRWVCVGYRVRMLMGMMIEILMGMWWVS